MHPVVRARARARSNNSKGIRCLIHNQSDQNRFPEPPSGSELGVDGCLGELFVGSCDRIAEKNAGGACEPRPAHDHAEEAPVCADRHDLGFPERDRGGWAEVPFLQPGIVGCQALGLVKFEDEEVRSAVRSFCSKLCEGRRHDHVLPALADQAELQQEGNGETCEDPVLQLVREAFPDPGVHFFVASLGLLQH
ncbi:hypothetical protein Mapa_012206 [Marchantia paleacea]|nr:hypothetical protein Mapa_012206 [Marchantia paleacea]